MLKCLFIITWVTICIAVRFFPDSVPSKTNVSFAILEQHDALPCDDWWQCVVWFATCWVALLCGVLVVYWPAYSFRVSSWRGHTSLTKEETDQWCRLGLRIKYQSRAKWYASIAICWGEMVIYRVSHRLLYIVIIGSHVKRGDVIILQYWWYSSGMMRLHLYN